MGVGLYMRVFILSKVISLVILGDEVHGDQVPKNTYDEGEAPKHYTFGAAVGYEKNRPWDLRISLCASF